jgi:hypothetical protein
VARSEREIDMGWLLWGILIGWSAGAFYCYTQKGEDADTTSNGAFVVAALLFLAAVAISIGLGMQSGAIQGGAATATPMGR